MGITEISTPSALAREGAHFSKALLPGRYPVHRVKAAVEGSSLLKGSVGGWVDGWVCPGFHRFPNHLPWHLVYYPNDVVRLC
jgi:hypothetical protein